MSDSHYSLRHLGARLKAAGAHVLGLGMPGHGTAPSDMPRLRWNPFYPYVETRVLDWLALYV